MKYFLKYVINNNEFATPVDEIVEVARPRAIHQLKNKNFIGSFDLRHETILVVDLASILKIKGRRGNEVMIAEIGGDRVGFCVDEVSGIIEHDEISPVPDLVKSHRSLTGMLTMKNTVIPVVSLTQAVSRANLSKAKNNISSANKK